MNVPSVLVAIFCLVAAASASEPVDFYGFYQVFQDCFGQAPGMCTGTDTCQGPTKANSTVGVSASGVTADGVTTVGITTDGVTPTIEGFTTVTPGYTPTTGECVCVSTDSSSTSVTESDFATGDYSYNTNAASSEASVETSSDLPEKICPCRLVDLLHKLVYVLNGTEYHDIYNQWLIDIQLYILPDESLSDEEKFINCIGSLSYLFMENSELEEILLYVKIEEFGYVVDFFTVVSQLQYNIYNADGDTLIAVSNGSCALFEAFFEWEYLSSDQNETLTLTFNNIVTTILEGNYTDIDKCILIYEQFYFLFKNNTGWEADFANVTIPGFGCFSQWYFMVKTYYIIYTLDYSLNGSDCVFIQALNSTTGYSASVEQSLGQYAQSLSVKFENYTDVYERLDVIMNTTYEFNLTESFDIPLLYNITFEIKYGDITTEVTAYELFYAAYYYFKFGFNCTLPSFGVTVTPGEISTVPEATTVIEETTTVPTEAEVTTKSSDGNVTAYCATNILGNISTVIGSNESCPIATAIYQTISSVSTTCGSELKTIVGRINNIAKQNTDVESRIQSIVEYMNGKPSGSTTCQNVMLNSTIYYGIEEWNRVCFLTTCLQTTYSDSATYAEVQCPN